MSNGFAPSTIKPWHSSGLVWAAVVSFGATMANVVNGVASRLVEGGHATLSDLPAILHTMYLTEWGTLVTALAVAVYTIFFNSTSVTPPDLTMLSGKPKG